MHIPDGFLSAPVCSSLAVISAAGIYVAMKKTKFDEEQSQIPLIGVTTAFIFAAQMINFPVGGVTSGHLAGGNFSCYSTWSLDGHACHDLCYHHSSPFLPGWGNCCFGG
ncbi:energy-coupling factor ABC transporter permease [Ammoniphilus sp. CFH 90114]|uniref:energy-coupling factor ABC transporter permease n=1 Tax=Ammoniphilus sp. CFH 90114 TaxID=2493665 RepID=UPI00100F7885|nr:energy-coupling factor ABC transporter permease [Ammoniphilus sp. CFH 90114]RXT14782.1 hypothetical protein EIZ39_00785 [Ammoniphilus sp. CFH 90114]